MATTTALPRFADRWATPPTVYCRGRCPSSDGGASWVCFNAWFKFATGVPVTENGNYSMAANPRSAAAMNARTRAWSFLPRCPAMSVWVNESTPHGFTAAIACSTLSAVSPPARITGA
jgi:hypothetical protein